MANKAQLIFAAPPPWAPGSRQTVTFSTNNNIKHQMEASFSLHRAGTTTTTSLCSTDDSKVTNNVDCPAGLNGKDCALAVCSFTIDRATVPDTKYFIEVSYRDCNRVLGINFGCGNTVNFDSDNFAIGSATTTAALTTTTLIPTTATTDITTLTTLASTTKLKATSKATDTVSPLPDNSDTGGGLSMGSIFGISLAALVAAMIAGIVVFWRRRVAKKSASSSLSLPMEKLAGTKDSWPRGNGPAPVVQKVETWKPVEEAEDLRNNPPPPPKQNSIYQQDYYAQPNPMMSPRQTVYDNNHMHMPNNEVAYQENAYVHPQQLYSPQVSNYDPTYQQGYQNMNYIPQTFVPNQMPNQTNAQTPLPMPTPIPAPIPSYPSDRIPDSIPAYPVPPSLPSASAIASAPKPPEK
ncbi:hypothetical protein HK098_006257 [Nowakowskiella sp. JEL0407]|nr:hypothetical protein HK098_006257 [Nowakowskiella sp. JEL0407]